MTDRAEGHDVHAHIAAIEKRHYRIDDSTETVRDLSCHECYDEWPCLVIQAVEENKALREAARDVVEESASWMTWCENRPLPHLSSSSDAMYAALLRLREMVKTETASKETPA